MTVALMITNPTVAHLKHINPKIFVGIGSALAVSGALMTSQVHTFGQLLITFSLVSAIGFGCCYFPPLQCGWEWMPQKKGLTTGIILGAFGFGAFVFSILAVQICNPNNASPTIIAPNGTKFYDAEIAGRVPTFFFWLAVCWACLGLFSTLVIKTNPDLLKSEDITADEFERMLTVKEALRTGHFWKLICMDFFSIQTFLYMSSVYKTMALQIGTEDMDDRFITMIGAFGSICNGGSRVLAGYLMDRFEFKNIYSWLLAV